MCACWTSSAMALKSFSDTGRRCWVIRSAISGYIDIEISASVLEQLRQAVEWGGPFNCCVSQSYASRESLKAWGSPLEFPMSCCPNCSTGTMLWTSHSGEDYCWDLDKIIHRIKTTGTIRPTGYDGQWQVMIYGNRTDEPANFYFPEPNYLPCDRAFIRSTSQILDDAPNRRGEVHIRSTLTFLVWTWPDWASNSKTGSWYWFS